VTHEYKKWLNQYADSKQKQREEDDAAAQKKEEFRKKLADRAQQQRDEIRSVRDGDLPEEEKTRRIGAIIAKSARDDEDQDTFQVAAETTAPSRQRQAPTPREWVRRPRAAKPAWARTEAENEDVMEEEADDLLNFADNLDYDAYVDDLEIRESARFIGDRVKQEELHREREAKRAEMEARKAAALAAGVVDEDDEDFEWVEVDARGLTAEEALVQRQRELLGKHAGREAGGWDNSTKTEARERAETPITAGELRKARPEIANVHSNASLRTVVSRITEERRAETPLAVPAPRMVVIDPVDGRDITDESTNRDKQKRVTRVSNLPYLYRNPAI
jgi:hypothetical protein